MVQQEVMLARQTASVQQGGEWEGNQTVAPTLATFLPILELFGYFGYHKVNLGHFLVILTNYW